MEEQEIWKVVEGYKKLWEVSSLGRVRDAETKRIRKPACVRDNKKNMISLDKKDGKKTMTTIARLVAIAFIPNPNNFPVVIHKNGDVADNRVSNLKWVSHSQKNAYSKGISVQTSLGVTYLSEVEAAKDLKISISTVRRALRDGIVVKGITLTEEGKEVSYREPKVIPDLPGEEWKTLSDISPFFKISNKGRVKRIGFIGPNNEIRDEKLLKSILSEGRPVVNLTFSVENKRFRRQISPIREVRLRFGQNINIKVDGVYSFAKPKDRKKK